MNASSILNYILVQADKNASDTAYRAQALKWLNLVIKDIQNSQKGFHWRFLEVKGATFNSAASDFDYAFATILPTTLIDTTKAIHVYEKTNDITLTFVPYERFRQMVADESASSGTPRWFSIFADNLLLYPVPDSIVAYYIDYVRMMPSVVDSTGATGDLLIPDKYEKVVIDGIMEFAYQLEPELGSRADQHSAYLEGKEQMKDENRQIIAENVKPVSHREKHNTQGEVNGKNSIEFPLDNTSI